MRSSPPSTTNECPVAYSEPGEASHDTMDAISCADPGRFIRKAQPLFALAQCRFRPLSFRDGGHHANHPHHPPAIVEKSMGGFLQPYERTIVTQHTVGNLDIRVFRCSLGHRGGEPRSVIRVDCGQYLLVRKRLIACRAEHSTDLT